MQEISSQHHSDRYASGEIIIKFKPDAFDEKGELISESIKALNNKYGLFSMEPLFKGKTAGDLTHIYLLKFSKEVDVVGLVREYTKDASVVYAEPNYIVQIF